MTFLQDALAHALGGLIEVAVLVVIFKKHKIHIGKDEVDL